MPDYRVPRVDHVDHPSNPDFAFIQAVLAKAPQAELADLTPGQRFVYAVNTFEMEVNSGGLDSYLRYTGGDSAPEALAGLREVGASKFAKVLETAMSLFPGGNPDRDTDLRTDQLDRILDKNPDAFETLDAEFFDAYDGEESLAKLLIKYIKCHPADFFLP